MAEVLHGDASGNQLNARADKSQVYGLKGNDTLTSNDKRDVLLVGGSGDDSLIMSGGNGTLAGGEGSDTFELTYSAPKPLSAVIEDLEPARDKIVVNFDGDTVPQLSSSATNDGNVILRDNAGNLNVTLKGIRDNDYFDGDASNEVWDVLALTNAERERQNLSALTMSDGLTTAAEIRVKEITALGESGVLDVFKHDRTDGSSYSSVFNEVGKTYSAYGENIQAGAASPEAVMKAWIDSPAHYANIVNPDFQKLGVGYNYDDSDPSNRRYYWEQLLGSSLNSPAPEPVDVSTASPEVRVVTKAVTLTEGNDTYSNGDYGVTIAALGGDDSIGNSGFNVSISGGSGADILTTGGLFTTINGGLGNDSINLNAAQSALIQYAAGDGSDTVSGLNATDTVSISGDEYTSATVGNDVVLGVGSDSITLTGAASLGSSLNIAGTENITADANLITLTDGDDTCNNTLEGATIAALGGNDTIYNHAANVSIDAGADDDSIYNTVDNVSINAGAGNDYIYDNWNDNVVFFHESGNDTVMGFNATSTLQVAGGNYASLVNGHNNLILINLDSKDSINLLGAWGLAKNIVDAEGNPVTVGSAGYILGTEQADSLTNTLDDATITALGGNDTITNNGANVTITGGVGNDSVNNQKHGTIYVYESGNDTVEGFNDSDSLNVGGCSYSTEQSGSDIVVNIIDNDATVGSVTLKDYSGQSVNIVSTYVPSNPGETIYNSTDSIVVAGTAADDDIENSGSNVTVNALAGRDTIRNWYVGNVTLNGDDDDDYIENSSSYVTINGGAGNDSIEIANYVRFVSVSAGAGNDTVLNFGGSDVTINGNGGDDTLINRGSDVTLNGDEGNDSISNDAARVSIFGGNGNEFIFNNTESDSVTIDGGAGADTVDNFGSDVTINDNDGNDSIRNWYASISIDGSTGADTVDNLGSDVTINSGAGNDYINNGGSNVTINAGAGNDSIENNSDSVSVGAGAGNDTIINFNGSDVTINGDVGDDYINNGVANVTINGGAGNDSIENNSDSVSVGAGAGNDTVVNFNGSDVTISGNDGDDALISSGSNVTINGGAGNDTINNSGANVSMHGGAGDDRISLSSSSRNNLVRYAEGDGNDTVWGITENDTLNFLVDDATLVSSVVSGDDLIYYLGSGSVLLIGARDKPPHITFGESGTSGGGSNNGGNGGNSSSGSGGDGGHGGGNTSGGTSSNEGRESAASGGRSSSGSSGRSSSSNVSSGGNSFRYIRNEHSTTANATTVTTNTIPEAVAQLNHQTTANATQPTSTPSTTSTQRVYTGGNQVIGDYTSGERIVFGATYTGAFYDGNGNFFAGSTTGALVVQNAADKVIDLKDAAGNDFVKAYSATTAGVIDGRGLAGFELINGSAGADAIYAGDGGSQLWGGADVASDAMLGGGGTDIFIGGKNQGADFFLNASAADIVHLNDTALSDIVATAEENGTIGIAFNTGNVVAVQSSEALSATVMLADGSAYKYNHANKSWQNA